jgi:hypothetical protein
MRSENLNAEGVFPYVSLLQRGKRKGNESTPSRECFRETQETRETKGEVNGDAKAKGQPVASAQSSTACLKDDATKTLTLTLRALHVGEAGWPPMSRRLAGLLKVCLRCFGFRCTRLLWHTPVETSVTSTVTDE